MAVRAFVEACDEDHLDDVKTLIPTLLNEIFRLMAEVGWVNLQCVLLFTPQLNAVHGLGWLLPDISLM